MKAIFTVLFCIMSFLWGIAQNNIVYISSGSLPNPITRELSTNLLPNRIEGIHYVGERGNAGYSIPLSLPPGTKNMVPELSVFFDSHLGNSILGYGWAIDGLHSITRTGRNNYFDNTTSTVKYD